MVGEGHFPHAAGPTRTRRRVPAGDVRTLDCRGKVFLMERELSGRDETVLAFDELVERCMGQIDFAERVLSKFEQTFGGDLTELEDLLERENHEEIALVAHRLKGASANVGAPRLCDRAAKIENLARAQRTAEIPPYLDQLRSEWSRFVESVGALDRTK